LRGLQQWREHGPAQFEDAIVRTGRPTVLTPAEQVLAKRLRREGQFYRVIGETIGRNTETVRRFLTGGRRKRKAGCTHYWGIPRHLHYPDGTLYGTLAVCVRCRHRKYANFETGNVRIDPPPRDR